MATENRYVTKTKDCDEKDAWDAYASAALASLITPGVVDQRVAAKAGQYATLMLEERRLAFPDPLATASSSSLKI
ncbi:hypothetical protein ACOI7N_27070 [Pseudomonas sp. P2758]|uniref:hypothetical protein n=1 Tax=unclassified Pseudomonas TaxID=196821 RepID=UPI003B59CBF3